jgi:hypothetical protein
MVGEIINNAQWYLVGSNKRGNDIDFIVFTHG